MSALPAFADLPGGSAWGVWGAEDRFGCWNNIDEAATRRGVAAARRGRTFALTPPWDAALCAAMGRVPWVHETRSIAGVAFDDVLHEFNTQASSQWDGFRHFGSAAGFYNGLAHEDHGVDHWALRGFATRGVLVDVAQWRASAGRPVDVAGGERVPLDDVLGCLDAQGTVVEPGDLLFFRWGWYEHWLAHGLPADGVLRVPGVEPTAAAAAQFWDWHVAAVAGDSGVDPLPAQAPPGPPPTAADLRDPTWCFGRSLHFVIPWLGLSIGEFFDLRALAADCAADGDWTFLLTVAPINLPAGIATPGNALAVR